MTYRVTIHSRNGKAHIETFDRRADAEQYRRQVLAEDPSADTHVTGQHEDPPVSLERARQWMTHIVAIWAAAPAFTDHNHHKGWEHCPICSLPAITTRPTRSPQDRPNVL